MSIKTASFVFRLFSVLMFLALMIGTQGVESTHAARILYATQLGTGDCSSWTTACTLQTALIGAVSSDEIWVAAGTHKPTAGTDRNATFQLKSGVALYGGFIGTEIARDQRNPMINFTILSGDLNGDDVWFANNAENFYHVVSGASGAILDGFTIKGGNADDGTTGPASLGGGMYNNSSSPLLMNIIFNYNSAFYGGGMENTAGSSPTLTNVTFSDNSASYRGGGMDNTSGSNPALTNVTFVINSAWLGGGMANSSSNPVLMNVTFSGNSGASQGGGMLNKTSSPTLTNVTFSNNSSDYYSNGYGNGGGIYNENSSNPQIRNTIFWGNKAGADGAQIFNDASSPIVSDSVVEGGYPAGSTCINIITTDPLLDALSSNGGFTQTIPLLAGSSAINAGNDTTCTAIDQRGVTRPQGAHCDIGAYEYTGIYYVKPVASGAGNCLSWTTACTLQIALTTAISGDEIWVAAGIHKPTTGTDRNATFQLKNGIALYGGFSGTETARDQRNPMTNVTTLSGDLNGDDVGFINNSENVYHVVTGATGATLDGFTITAGHADGTDPNNSGGGMYNSGGSSPVLMNITFSGNTAMTGGGMDNYYSNPTLMNITFSNNSASMGGGMDNNYSSPILTNVTFNSNSAGYGGGMYNNSGNPTMTNITFSGNEATGNGGGMENDSYSYPIIRNTIFWGNTATTNGAAQMYNDSSTPVISYSVIKGGCPAGSTCTNIIIDDPILGALGNYGGFTQTIPLMAGSSAIDSGNDATCAATDQRGIIRPQGSHCDIGAYEYFVPIFVDVPFSYWANSYIERLYNAGVTGGCGTSPLIYCPDNTVTRAQMAVFLLKGMHGSSYIPPAVGTSTGFNDVTTSYWAAAWIKQLAVEGVTGGCSPGNYCPDATVTRAQMAVFLLKAKHGSSYLPPAATGVFTDVPVGYWADKWIEQLASEGITGGCGAGTYCPDDSVTRAQMAVFLVKAFNLP